MFKVKIVNHVADPNGLFGSIKAGQGKDDRLRIRVEIRSQYRKIHSTELMFHTCLGLIPNKYKLDCFTTELNLFIT